VSSVQTIHTLVPVIPDGDIWLGALRRQDPVPLAVTHLGRLVEQRRVFLLGWLRQSLLSRCADPFRLQRLLSAFPDLPVLPEDHLKAAHLAQRLRREGAPTPPLGLLLWAVAERLNGQIWSLDRAWLRLVHHGCPLVTEPSSYERP
jgi:predicted nucleic acid-binding protein